MAPQAKDGGRGNRVHPTPVFIGNWFTTKLFYSKQQFHVLSLLSLLWLVLPITRYYILFGVEKSNLLSIIHCITIYFYY